MCFVVVLGLTAALSSPGPTSDTITEEGQSWRTTLTCEQKLSKRVDGRKRRWDSSVWRKTSCCFNDRRWNCPVKLRCLFSQWLNWRVVPFFPFFFCINVYIRVHFMQLYSVIHYLLSFVSSAFFVFVCFFDHNHLKSEMSVEVFTEVKAEVNFPFDF